MLKAIGQLFQKKNNSKELSDYLKWREVIFSVTSGQVGVLSDKPNNVYGVIMDAGLSDDFVISITAFPTGESSVRTTVGGGAIGLGGDKIIAEQARHIVTLAQSLLEETRPIGKNELPKSQKIRLHFLTTSGLRFNETTIKDADMQNHPFHEIFGRFTAIKTRSEELVKTYSR